MPHDRATHRRVLPAAAALLALVSACAEGTRSGGPATSAPAATSQSGPSTTPTTSATPATTPMTSTTTTSAARASTSTAKAATPATCAARIAARLTPAQQAGQLLMVGLQPNGNPDALARQVAAQQLGAVIYLGGWHNGSATVRSVSKRLQAAAAARARQTGTGGLLIAADQEGGEVQQLRGAGFTRIPSARRQASLGPAGVQRGSTVWARELLRAGVNVNLAPVADTVPTSLGDANAPVGAHNRDFVPGDPVANGRYAAAAVRGILTAGAAPAVKHFPGLGRVRSNTDFSATGITDRTTTSTDPYLAPFRAAIAAGAPLVMLSSATYTRIDPERQAMFSPPVISDLLRGRLGFEGVVISDDVGAAEAVAAIPVGERATRFVAAGGDIVLTAEAGQARAMIAALTARAAKSPAFRAQIAAAATRVVALKVRLGLARCG